MIGNPNLKYKELEALYQYGFDIPKTIIEQILSLPRESIIEDLKEVLLESIRNFKNYGDASDEGRAEHLFIAPIHAFFLLGTLEAESALPVFEQFLEQEEEVLDFWIGDVLTEMLWQPIYEITKKDIKRVIPFLKKPTKDVFAKSGHEMALFNYLQLHPEDRASLIPVLRDLVNELMAKAKEKEEWDEYNESLDFIAESILDANCIELEKELEIIVKKGLTIFYSPTEWDEVKELLYEPADYPELLDIFQKYKAISTWFSYADSEDIDDFMDYDEEGIDYDALWNERKPQEKMIGNAFYPPNPPFKKETPKVGRNEPCPCGSGKKYKKCCLNN